MNKNASARDIASLGTDSAPKKKGFFRSMSLNQRKAMKGWLFVLPFVVGILILYLPIILDSICLSFFRVIPDAFNE